MDPSTDFVGLMLSLEQPDFIARCPFPFLVAVNEPVAAVDLPAEQTTLNLGGRGEAPATQPASGRPVVYAVRKVHPLVPQAIILGRASSCDIVISDRQVSKTHALFQDTASGWQLSDSGSRNGTWVGNRRLTPRGDAVALSSCDILSFGHRAYLFLDSGDCWEQIRGAAGSK